MWETHVSHGFILGVCSSGHHQPTTIAKNRSSHLVMLLSAASLSILDIETTIRLFHYNILTRVTWPMLILMKTLHHACISAERLAAKRISFIVNRSPATVHEVPLPCSKHGSVFFQTLRGNMLERVSLCHLAHVYWYFGKEHVMFHRGARAKLSSFAWFVSSAQELPYYNLKWAVLFGSVYCMLENTILRAKIWNSYKMYARQFPL